MAKRKSQRGRTTTKRARTRTASRKKTAARPARRTAKAAKPKRAKRTKAARPAAPGKAHRLDRARRTLADIVPTPPSSLNMDRHGSAARTGRVELEESREAHRTMTPAITAGDVDANVENAYFSGDEAPGGDNPTPDQDVVEDIGRALGVEYQDNEELRSTDKLNERDKHRWELDPASSEDYKDRK
jgi:uncharacterized protein DUF6335